MPWYEWIVAVLLFVVSLGVLITIHEAGHLAMAKLFKVYCHEFSIGFGPSILHKRKEGKETYFSIRAIPFGGYVSMYGEEGSLPEECKDIPESRSLEGIKKWKKAIVVLAGVILNAFLALGIFAVSNLAFPIVGMTRRMVIEEKSIAAEIGLRNDDMLEYVFPANYKDEDGSINAFYYEYEDKTKLIHAGQFFIVDTNAVSDSGNHYVVGFMYTGDKGNPSLSEGMLIYEAISKSAILGEDCSYKEVQKLFKEWAQEEGSPEYYPNFELGNQKLKDNLKITANLHYFHDGEDGFYDKTVDLIFENGAIKDLGISFATRKIWLPFGTRVKNTFVDFGNGSVAVFKGLGILFRGGIKNMSGIVGIFDTSATLYRNYTFQTYLYFWGLISVNLAIFNLLPFPGLDGWQLLVTIIEGVSRKKIPQKFKGIMSAIGLALLFILMIVIIGLDIVRIVGV